MASLGEPRVDEGLARIGRVWASETPTQEFLELVRHADEEPEIWNSLMEDILVRRNEHLIAAIDSNLAAYQRIVIPWGALHLPTIEAAIGERGFEQVSSAQHRLFSWATLFAALAQTSLRTAPDAGPGSSVEQLPDVGDSP